MVPELPESQGQVGVRGALAIAGTGLAVAGVSSLAVPLFAEQVAPGLLDNPRLAPALKVSLPAPVRARSA